MSTISRIDRYLSHCRAAWVTKYSGENMVRCGCTDIVVHISTVCHVQNTLSGGIARVMSRGYLPLRIVLIRLLIVAPTCSVARAPRIHQMIDTVSPTLHKQREAEEVHLKTIIDRQTLVPSWWPAAQGVMSGRHYLRLRRAEKILLREMRQATARRLNGGAPQSAHR